MLNSFTFELHRFDSDFFYGISFRWSHKMTYFAIDCPPNWWKTKVSHFNLANANKAVINMFAQRNGLILFLLLATDTHSHTYILKRGKKSLRVRDEWHDWHQQGECSCSFKKMAASLSVNNKITILNFSTEFNFLHTWCPHQKCCCLHFNSDFFTFSLCLPSFTVIVSVSIRCIVNYSIRSGFWIKC